MTVEHPHVLAFALALELAFFSSAASAQNTPAVPAESPARGAVDVRQFTDNEPAAAAKSGKTLHALRVSGNAPKIDGTLDDDVWTHAEMAGDFVQWDPNNGEPASERSVMQVAYDDRFVYVAIRCFDRTPEAISRGLGRRDDSLPTDNFAIGFDPRHDHLTGYVFQVNPSGVQSDQFNYDDDRSDRDFDMVWEVRTATTADGWTAEFRIPFSQMRFKALPAAGQLWGFSAARYIRRKNEVAKWTARPRGERGDVSRWGHLIFDDPLAPPRRVELLPYTLARSQRDPDLGDDFSASAGFDMRVGIGTSATLSATVNPDFGQVEQDPAVLNLSIFESFFPEKRPFFLEDSRTFVPPYGLFQAFYSRRIGRRPGRFAVPTDATIVEMPNETHVLGAAKLTGKGSGWTYGVMTSATAREYARLDNHSDFLVEPLTSYNTVRIQRDIRNGTSNIGGIFTGVVREKDDDAYTGGVDYNLRWDRNRTAWSGHWLVTHAPGAPQTGDVATSAGGVTNFSFSRKHYGFAGHFDHFGRDFRVGDLGFFRTRPNRNEADGNVSLEQPDPWKKIRHSYFQIFGQRAWSNEGYSFNKYVGGYFNLQFMNFWYVEADFGRNFETVDDLDTRGGPPIIKPAQPFLDAFLSSDSRKSWRFNLGVNLWKDAYGGYGARVGPGITVQPSGRLTASASGGYTSARDSAQWITNTDINGDGVVDNVYGTLRRNVVDITVRSTFSIHRDMTLQLFLQPFVAVGAYSNVRRLAQPISYDFESGALTYNPDFNSKSMRSNVVLRWEYVRGSTFYAVWNMSKSDAARPGIFGPLHDLGDAFGGDGPNVFMVKISYWLAR